MKVRGGGEGRVVNDRSGAGPVRGIPSSDRTSLDQMIPWERRG